MKFLVIQQKMVGDVLASTVICESLKHFYPDCRVHFVANENTLPVLQNNPYIDKIIVFTKEYRMRKSAFFGFLISMREETYYAVFDAYGKLESNLISLFSRSKFKIAHYKGYTSWIYTDTVIEKLTSTTTLPLASYNRLRLLEPLLKKANDYVAHPKLFLDSEETNAASKKIATIKAGPDQKLIMIGILGSSSLKSYPVKFMAEVLEFICAHTKAKLLLNYIPGQEREVMAIFEICSNTTKERIAVDFYAASLREFMAILSQCCAIIGNEGGAVNIAKALDIPSFSIFSPFILKAAWHSTDTQKHLAVHLADFLPDLIRDKSKKVLKRNHDELYAVFEPRFITPRLRNFLDLHCI